MNKNNIIDNITQFTQPIIDEMGYKFVRINFTKENDTRILQIYVDKKGGITIDDCEHISRIISAELDKKDIIPQHYNLEVSSAGERELHDAEDIEMHLNEGAKITLKIGDVIEGILQDIKNDNLYLKNGDNIRSIPMKNIKKIKLKFIF
jgi:ribosome maturation factor RimP